MAKNPEPVVQDYDELEALIRDTREPLVILVGETYHPGTHLMGERLRGLQAEGDGFKLVELTLRQVRPWASRYDVVGTPTVLLFRGGELRGRLPGVLEEVDLEDALLGLGA